MPWIKVLVYVSVSVAALVLASKYLITPNKEESRDSSLDDKKNKKKIITKKKLISIFNDIALGMQHVITQLQDIKTQQAENSQKDNINSILRQQYLEALPSIEEQAYRRHNVTKSEVQTISEMYHDDPDFQRITNELRQLDQSLLGQPLDATQVANKVPNWLTVDKLLEILTIMMNNMTIAMEETVVETQSETEKNKIDSIQNSNDNMYEKVMQKYTIKVNKIREQIHNDYEINQEILKCSIAKYQKNDVFITKWNELRKIQKLRFEKCGIHQE